MLRWQVNSPQDLVDVVPLLLPTDTKGLNYAGYITSGKDNFHMKIVLQEPDEVKNAWIEVDWRLRYLLKGCEAVIKKRLEQSSDLFTFMLEFKSIVDQVVQCNNTPSSAPPPPSLYISVVKDIEIIGWNRIVSFEQNFSEIKISSRDPANREHVLSIHISDKHPSVAPVCNASLPLPFHPTWSTSSTLPDLLRQFEEEINSYQEFWNEISEIDSETWVLEPQNPSYSCVYRRIVIDNNVSLYTTVDPLRPNELPECRYLGPDHATDPLIQRQSSNECNWDKQMSLLDNLCNMLKVKFPSRITADEEEYTIECGICYTEYHMDTMCLPDLNCPNALCSRPFHHHCLYEWLNSLPSSNKSFGMIKGECPYCCNMLSVKVINE